MYTIHQVQYPPKIVCLPFILLVTSWIRNVASASSVPPYMIDRHQAALHESSMMASLVIFPRIRVNYPMNRVLSPSVPSIQCLLVRVQSHSITVSICISKPAGLPPTSLHDRGLQVHLQTCSIMASKCISKLSWSRPPRVSPNSLNYGLHMPIPKLAWWQSRSASPKFTQSRPPSVSRNTLDYCFQVHLQTCSIMGSECISEFTWSSFSGAPRIALKHRLQPVHIYHLLMGSYIDSSIHRSIDT